MKKKNHTVTTLLLTGIMLYSAVSLASAAEELREAKEMTESLTKQAEIAETENRILGENAAGLNGDDAVKNAAEEAFGFTDADEIVFADLN